MAYPKITVNTGIAIPVFAHDTIPIPNPNVDTLIGTGTSVAQGSNNLVVVSKLTDTTRTGVTGFDSTVSPLPISSSPSDLVFNITTPGNATVTNVDSANTLELSADIFQAQPENYLITRPNHLIDVTASFTTSAITDGDIVYNTTTNAAAFIKVINNDKDLTLSSNIFGSETTYNDAYKIYKAGSTGLRPGVNSAQGCILYVAANVTPSSVASSYMDIQVITTAVNTVLFKSFPIGNYLPVQITHLMSTGTTDAAEDGTCIAIW